MPGSSPIDSWRSRGRYVAANFSAFVPAFVGILILAFAPYLINIAADCPPAPDGSDRDKVVTVLTPNWRVPSTADSQKKALELEREKGNPLICKTQAWWDLVKDGFEMRRVIRDRLGEQPPEIRALSDQLRKDRRALLDALRDEPGKAAGDLELLRERESHTRRTLELVQAERLAALAAAARELKARLNWTAALSLFLLLSVITVFLSVWVTVDALMEVSQKRLLFTIWIVGVILISGIYYTLYNVVGDVVFANILRLPESSDYYYFFPNNLVAYIDEHLMPGLKPLIWTSSHFVAAAGIGLALAVTACLLQDPSAVVQQGTADAPAVQGQAEALRAREVVLFRGHRRLQIILVMAGALLASGVNHVATLFSWPLALLPTGLKFSEEKAVSAVERLSTDMADMVQAFAAGFGVAATLTLAAVLLPAALSLRERAWKLARDASQPGATASELEQWLTARGLFYSLSGRAVQVLALLAPAAAGVVGSLLTSAIPN